MSSISNGSWTTADANCVQLGPIYRKEHILSVPTIAIMLYSMLLRRDWVGLVSELKGTRVSR